jgi:peptidoglycan pentaglycine glycine transferase (the first glycine)
MGKDKLQVTVLTAAEKDRWNTFVSKVPDFALMQTYEWGEFKEASGWQIARVAVEKEGQLVAGAQMFIRPMPFRLARIAYIPRGPLLDWQDKAVGSMLLGQLHKVARKQRAIVLKIEPPISRTAATGKMLQSYGFIPSEHTNQPSCTMIIDLTPDIDTILANMHKRTRYNIRYSARKGVKAHVGDESDLSVLYRLIQFTASRSGFPVRSLDYYKQEWQALARQGLAKLFLAFYEGEVIAFRMLAAFGGKAATLHSGSLSTHRELKPNELLMWKSIEWAKEQGCTSYDVWGIAEEVGELVSQGKPIPENQKGGLWGVYYFKRGFGGKVVYYVGAYDFVYSPLVYRLMNMGLTRLGSLDKLAQLTDRLKF